LLGSGKVGLSAYRSYALQELASLLQFLGREAEGEELLREAERAADTADECVRVDFWANSAWFPVRSTRDLDGAAKLLDRVVDLRHGRCFDATALVHALTDYAVLRLLEGDDVQARRMLDAARREAPSPSGLVLASWLDIEGQLALRGPNPG